MQTRAGSFTNNSYNKWLIPGALACNELFEAIRTTHTKSSTGTDENPPMLFMCQWISDCSPKKSDNNSLSIHITRRSQNSRPSLHYNVTHSTLVILIKAGCIIVHINATCELLNLIQLMSFKRCKLATGYTCNIQNESNCQYVFQKEIPLILPRAFYVLISF